MTLSFVLGPAGAGKTRYVVDAVKEDAGKAVFGTPLLVLVPEQTVSLMEQTLSKDWPTGFFRVCVTSFRDLAKRAGTFFGRKGESFDPGLERLLLHTIGETRQNSFRYFRDVEITLGLVDAVARTLKELRQYRAHENLRRLASETVTADKIHDLRIFAQGLRSCLPAGKLLEGDLVDSLIELIPKWDFLAGARVYIDGFSTLTGQEEEALFGLIAHTDSVEMTLCLDPSRLREDESEPCADRVFAPTVLTYRRITEICRAEGIRLGEAKILSHGKGGRFSRSPGLKALEEAWRGDSRGNRCGDSLNLLVCPDIESEVRTTANEILTLVRDKCFRFRDIGVIVRRLDLFEDLIRREFSRRGIPFFVPGRPNVGNHSIVHLLRVTSRILIDDLDPESVGDYLKSDLLPASRDDTDRLEKFLVEEGLFGKRLFDEGKWKSGGDETSGLKGIRDCVLGPVMNLGKSLEISEGRASLCRYGEMLTTYFRDLGVEDRLRSAGFRDTSPETAEHLWDRVVRFIEGLLELPNVEIAWRTFFETVVAHFENLGGPPEAPTLDHVSVGAVDRSRMGDLRAVFLLGMNEGIFPAPVSEGGLINDNDREALRKSGIRSAPTSGERLLHEDYLVYIALTRSSEILTISWSSADREGRPLNPSPYVERLLDIFPDIRRTTVQCREAQPSLDDVGHVADFAQLYLRATSSGKGIVEDDDVDPLKKDSPVQYTSKKTWDAARRRIEKEIGHSRFAKPFRSLDYENKAQLKRYAPAQTLDASVSSLEQFAECPFQYFAGKTLRLREKRPYEPDPIEMGNLAHLVLQTLFERIKSEGRDWRDIEEGEILGLVNGTVELLSERDQRGVFRSTGAGRQKLDTLKRSLVDLVSDLKDRSTSSRFQQAFAETTFGLGDTSPLPALALHIDDRRVLRLRGKIDRVDVVSGSGRFIVVDYKLSESSETLDPARVYAGLDLQLLTYLLLLKELGERLSEDGFKEPAGAFYLNVVRNVVTVSPDEEMERAPRKARGILTTEAARDLDVSCDSGYSRYYPFRINKDGSLGARGSNIRAETMGKVLERLKTVLVNLGKDILRGNIAVRPYLYKKKSPCDRDRCSYRSLCRFDFVGGYGGYRRIQETGWEEFSEKVSQ